MEEKQIIIEEFDEAGDAAFRVTAGSLKDFFVGCGNALSELIFPQKRESATPSEEEAISLRSEDLELLLVDFLSELIYLFETKGFIPSGFDLEVGGEAEFYLLGQIRGFCLPSAAEGAEYELGLIPKGISYHLLSVEQRGESWEGQFVLDA